MFEDDELVNAGLDFVDEVGGLVVYKPMIIVALLYLFIMVWDFFGSIMVEYYRMGMITDDIHTVMGIASKSAERRFQETNVEEFMFSGASLSGNYIAYLNDIEAAGYGVSDSNLVAIAKLLRGQGTREVIYTPLSFDLTYLDVDILTAYFKEDVEMLLEQMLKTDHSRDSMGSALIQDTVIGEYRLKVKDAYVVVNNFEILDITDMSGRDAYTTGVYAHIFGTSDLSAGVLSAPHLDITGRRYLVVYDITYYIEWFPYANTSFFRVRSYGNWDHGVYANADMRNDFGYCKYPEIVTKFTKKYCITN